LVVGLCASPYFCCCLLKCHGSNIMRKTIKPNIEFFFAYNIFLISSIFIPMDKDKAQTEQEEKLKQLKEKPVSEEIKKSIDKKLKQGSKPFNK
jgi:hypothetical protein